MSIEQVIEASKTLTAREKALIAHCLISSLETRQDDDTDSLWADLAEERYKELVSGKVNPTSWEKIKEKIRQ